MEDTDVRVLDDEWKRLVNEYREAMREARMSCATRDMLQGIDGKYTFLVDSAYARLKYAEARAEWGRRTTQI